MEKYLSIILVFCLTLTSLFSCNDGKVDNGESDIESVIDSESESESSDESNSQLSEDSSSESDTELPEEEPLLAQYERVVIIGVDGAGAFFKDTDTPNIDRIFENGAVTYTAQTATPSNSAQCWGSLLIGVTTEYHRLNNDVAGTFPYDPDSIFPSIFRLIREKYPDALLASFCNWNEINKGIIENNLRVYKETGNDYQVTQKICTYLQKNDPKLLFVQFDAVDGAGHSSGYGSARHLAEITMVDTYIGQIYEAYNAKGVLDSTLFIVTADHGGTSSGYHGGPSPEEMNIMYAVVGKTITKGTIGDMSIRDNAAIVAYALGIEPPKNWTARIPGGVFEGVDEQERPVYIPQTSESRLHESVPTPAIDSGRYLTDFISSDRIRAYLTLDETEADALGKLTTTVDNRIDYIEGYYGEAASFMNGYISLNDYAPGTSSFTIAFWFKTTGVETKNCILSNKNYKNSSSQGYSISLDQNGLQFNFGSGSAGMESEYPLPSDFYDGWIHVTLVVNREANIIRYSYDFGNFTNVRIPQELRNSSFDGYSDLNIGRDGTGSYASRLSAVLDDIIIFDGVLTSDDLKSLSEYYAAD
ncbi:MAG: hypothetical protein E7672_00180 [Ruminococcaceae bacterium]|nr:hypothetical protein [Oscillospiraceae bacterium]